MIVKSRHKRFDLAERHARQLAKQNPGAEVRILFRRNDAGRFSANGRNFTFEIKPISPPAAEPKAETGEGGRVLAAKPSPKEIRSLDDFFSAYDDASDYDYYDIDGGVDYGTQE